MFRSFLEQESSKGSNIRDMNTSTLEDAVLSDVKRLFMGWTEELCPAILAKLLGFIFEDREPKPQSSFILKTNNNNDELMTLPLTTLC